MLLKYQYIQELMMPKCLVGKNLDEITYHIPNKLLFYNEILVTRNLLTVYYINLVMVCQICNLQTCFQVFRRGGFLEKGLSIKGRSCKQKTLQADIFKGTRVQRAETMKKQVGSSNTRYHTLSLCVVIYQMGETTRHTWPI